MKAGTQEHAAAQQRRNVRSESRRATEIGAAFVAQADKLDLKILEESNTSSRGSYDDEVTKASASLLLRLQMPMLLILMRVLLLLHF